MYQIKKRKKKNVIVKYLGIVEDDYILYKNNIK